jgi:hypothetical protein
LYLLRSVILCSFTDVVNSLVVLVTSIYFSSRLLRWHHWLLAVDFLFESRLDLFCWPNMFFFRLAIFSVWSYLLLKRIKYCPGRIVGMGRLLAIILYLTHVPNDTFFITVEQNSREEKPPLVYSDHEI